MACPSGQSKSSGGVVVVARFGFNKIVFVEAKIVLINIVDIRIAHIVDILTLIVVVVFFDFSSLASNVKLTV